MNAKEEEFTFHGKFCFDSFGFAVKLLQFISIKKGRFSEHSFTFVISSGRVGQRLFLARLNAPSTEQCTLLKLVKRRPLLRSLGGVLWTATVTTVERVITQRFFLRKQTAGKNIYLTGYRDFVVIQYKNADRDKSRYGYWAFSWQDFSETLHCCRLCQLWNVLCCIFFISLFEND